MDAQKLRSKIGEAAKRKNPGASRTEKRLVWEGSRLLRDKIFDQNFLGLRLPLFLRASDKSVFLSQEQLGKALIGAGIVSSEDEAYEAIPTLLEESHRELSLAYYSSPRDFDPNARHVHALEFNEVTTGNIRIGYIAKDRVILSD